MPNNGTDASGRRRVVITGIGVLSPLGNSVDEMWEAAIAGRSGIGRLSILDQIDNPEAYGCQVSGEVHDFEPTDYMDRKVARRMARFSQFAVATSKQAVANAQLDVPADGALLRAVSGLAPDDLALAGTRPDGRPFLAAPARQAVVATSSATHTVPITGTSAAAAVASAAAAVAWAYRPDLDSGGVRWQVLNGGHSLTGSPEAELPIAEFCEGGFEDCCVDENASVCGDPWMRRVSVCGALLAAHEDCQAFCPGCTCPVDCGVGTAPFEDTPVVGLLVEQDCAAPPCTAELVAADTAETVAGCAAPVYRLVDSPTGALENPCVAEQFYDAVMQPRVDPQPDKPPCPHCFAYLDPPGSQVELDLGFDPGVPEILGVTLKVTDPTTGAAVTLDITSAVLDLDLAAGGRYHVTVANLNAGVLGARSRVELSFRFGGPLHDYARTSELGTFLAP